MRALVRGYRVARQRYPRLIRARRLLGVLAATPGLLLEWILALALPALLLS